MGRLHVDKRAFLSFECHRWPKRWPGVSLVNLGRPALVGITGELGDEVWCPPLPPPKGREEVWLFDLSCLAVRHR